MKNEIRLNNSQLRKVKMNKRLVFFVIKTYNIKAKQEYESAGNFGLVKAVANYEESKGKFSTYAVRCIFNEIMMEIRKEKKNKRDVSLDNGVLATDEEGNEFTFQEILSKDNDIEDKFTKQETIKEVIYYILNYLTKREIYVVMSLLSGKTSKVIASEFGFTHGNVSKINAKALKKVKDKMNDNDKSIQKYKVNVVNDKILIENDEKVMNIPIDKYELANSILAIVENEEF